MADPALDALAALFSVTPQTIAPVAPGTAVTLGIIEPTTFPADTVAVTSAPIQLDILTKHVGLNDTSPFPPANFSDAVTGNFPLPVLPATATLPAGTVVDGFFGRIQGLLPISVTKPTVEVRWAVFKAMTGGTPLQEGADFVAPSGLASLSASFVIRPEIRDFPIVAIEKPPFIYIEASVRLVLGARSSEWTALPRVPVPLLPMFAPRLFVAFTDTGYKGHVLVVIPKLVGFSQIGPLMDVLDVVSTTTAKLNFFANFALLLTGLNRAIGGIATAPTVAFRDADFIDDLDDVRMYEIAWWPDRYWDSEASSFVCLLPASKQFKFWEDQSRDNASITVQASAASTPGNVISMCGNMHYLRPPTEPPNTLTFDGKPGVIYHDWGNEIECVEFL